MWLLKACFLLIFPEPVSLKRFLALDFVFCFGIFTIYVNLTFTLIFNRASISELEISAIHFYMEQAPNIGLDNESTGFY